MGYKTHFIPEKPQMEKTRATFKRRVMADLGISITSAIVIYSKNALGAEFNFSLV